MHLKITSPQPVPQALIGQIIQDALKNATMAPTHTAALDITGAALVTVARLISRNGVRHG